MANKNSTEPAIHLSKLSYYDNGFVTSESGALETRRWIRKHFSAAGPGNYDQCNEVPRIIASTTKTNAMILNRLTCPNQLLIISTLMKGYFKNAAMRYLTHVPNDVEFDWRSYTHRWLLKWFQSQHTNKYTPLGQTAQLVQHCIGIGIAEVSFEFPQD